MATTMSLIRKQFCGSVAGGRGVLELLTPTLAQEKGSFARFKPGSRPIDSLAHEDKVSSAHFRKFQWRVTSDSQEPEVLADPILRIDQVSLIIAYPVMANLYGPDELDSMEDLIRSDAHQLRDALLSPGNLIAGCQACLPTIKNIDRQEKVWFQEISLEIIYYENQTLT